MRIAASQSIVPRTGGAPTVRPSGDQTRSTLPGTAASPAQGRFNAAFDGRPVPDMPGDFSVRRALYTYRLVAEQPTGLAPRISEVV